MPSIQDFNAFKNAVNQLGNEPEITQVKDEFLEDIQPGEKGATLMPELFAAREALESHADPPAELPQAAIPEEQSPEIIMSDDEVRDEENLAPYLANRFDDAENEPDDEPSYTFPKEFDALLSSLDEDESSEPEDLLETNQLTDDKEQEKPNPQDEAAMPQDVYQMLDTGFGELDKERLDILDEEEIPVDTRQDNSQEVHIPAEEPMEDDDSPGEIYEENREEPSEEIHEDTEALEGSALQDKIPDESAFNEEAQREDQEETPSETAGDIDGNEAKKFFEEAEGNELPAPPEQTLSVLESVAQLEKALQQYRSIDLLSIGEEEIEEAEKSDEYEELEFRISQESARDFLLQLGSYPIALKLAIEKSISQSGLNEEAIETLIEMVSIEAKPHHVVNYFFSQTGKRILLSKGQRYYAIHRGNIDSRFHRQFVQIGLPWVRHICFGIVLLALFFWLPFYYAYRPIQAYLYYQKGYSEIFRDDFNSAERYFSLANNGWPLFNDSIFVKGWPFRSWYLKYAHAYASRKDFIESTFKLRETLRNYPDYREAWFQYIILLSQQMGEYEKAEEVIQQYYNHFDRDYNSLIIRGQNYLDWGDVDPVYYEKSREVFGATYGQESKNDLPLIYFLDSYIRTVPQGSSNIQLQKLTSFFLNTDSLKLEIPSGLFTQIMSKTVDYYLTSGEVEIAEKLLLNASKVNSDSMDIYRSFARYYNMIGDTQKELEALDMSLFFLNHRNITQNLQDRLSLMKQRANFVVSNSSQPFEASFIFSNLLVQLKKLEQRHLYVDQSETAEIYAIFGDFYYQNIPHSLSAIPYYQKAISLGFQAPYINYRYGYQLYQQKDFKHAVVQFLQSQLQLTENYKVKYALGNSLLQTGNYNSAQGILEEVYSSIQEDLRQNYFLNPQQSQEARDRLFMLVRLANDLGVSYYRESLQSANTRNEEMAMAYFIQGLGYLDILGREDTVSLKLTPELLFRPRLLTQKTIDLLENAIPAQGLIPDSRPDLNFKQILESKITTPTLNTQIQPYWMNILDPAELQQTMDY